MLLLFVATAAGPRYPLAPRPGPATDHRHCGPALRRSPYLWGALVAWCWVL